MATPLEYSSRSKESENNSPPPKKNKTKVYSLTEVEFVGQHTHGWTYFSSELNRQVQYMCVYIGVYWKVIYVLW